MVKCRLILVFLCGCLSIQGEAQQFSTKFFNVKDGLPQSQVLSLAEDKLGYLWLGTYGGGLPRFDGRHFSVYTLEDGIRDNYIHKVYIDNHNNVWAGTSKGLSKFDGRKFINYKELTSVFTHMVEFNDTLFAVTQNNKLFKIFNDSICCLDCTIDGVDDISFLVSNSPDCFYFVANSLLHRRDKTGNQQVDIAELGKINNIFPTGDSALIISSLGAYRWSKNKLKLIDARIKTPLVLTNDNLSTFWALGSTGLEKITNHSSVVNKEAVRLDAAPTEGINDAEGNTWFGTSGNGLMKYFANDFELMGNQITVSILKTNNNRLWAATRFHGVNIYDGDRLERTIPMESLGKRLKALRKDIDGNIWVDASSDLVMINPRSYHSHKFTTLDGLKTANISNIETDSSRRVWVSYRGEGIQFLDEGKFKDFPLNKQLSSLDVLGLKYIPYGERLMVCTSNGVDEIKKGSVSKLNIPEFYKTPILCAAQYKKRYVIFGTDGKGLCIYNLDNSSVRYYSKKHGLVSGLICFINTDDEGYVWVGSNYGIEKIKFNETLEIEEYYYFSDANGLNGLETNVNASFISGHDKYFGLIDGLYHYASKRPYKNADFELHFTRVELANSSRSLDAFAEKTFGFYKVSFNPQLPFDQNSIRFNFSKVSKSYPESTEYKYILVGQDKEWSIQNIDGDVRYRDLRPGKYTFKVMATRYSGKWTSPNLEYSFVIEPPFYKTTFFLGISALLIFALFALAMYYLIQRRVRHALAFEEMKANEIIRLRKEIGRDFHDELGNQLARIINYISLIKLNRDKSMEMLTLVEESAKNLIGGTRDFIWALDHENDTLFNLFVHLKDFGDRLFNEKNIEFRAFNSINSDVKLPVGHTRQINLIIKESMTNCFKHAQATCVDLDFHVRLSDLRISFRDNGVGISSEKGNMKTGGLSNIRHRAERINSRFEAHSNGHGTEINLYIKLKI